MKRLYQRILSSFSRGYHGMLVNVKIRNKLLMAFSFFMLIPTLLSAAINQWIINPLMIQNTVELERGVLSQYCNDINARMSLYDRMSVITLYDKNLLRQLNHQYTSYLDMTLAYYDYFNKLAEPYGALSKNLIRVMLYVDNPTLVYDTVTMCPQDEAFMQSPLYQDVFIDGNVKGVHLDEEGNILFYRVLNFYQSQYRYPVLCFRISPAEIISPLSNANIQGDIVVFDTELQAISINASEDAQRKLLESVPQMSGHSGILGRLSFSDDVIIYQKTDFGWTVAKIVEPTTFFTDALYVRNITMWLMILCIGLLTGLILAISKWLTDRIHRLIAKIDAIKAGIYDSPVLAQGRDEIGQASRALDSLSDELEYLIDTVYKSQLANNTLKLDVMQAQINPHFLYNTLSAIDWFLQKNDVDTSRELLNSMVFFYRCTLGSGSDIVTIADEIAHLRMYLAIEERLIGNIRYQIDIPQDLQTVQILRMTLQPIVENALKHAVKSSEDTLHIRVEGFAQGDTVCIAISDDGVGFEPAVAHAFNTERTIPAKTNGSGMGIRNVDLRLRLHFGEAYGVHIDQSCKQGACVYIRVPYQVR